MRSAEKSRKPSWVTEYVGVNFQKVPSKPADGFAPSAAVDTEPAVHKSPAAPTRRPLYFAVFAAYLGSMAFGFAITYSSPALPDVRPRMNFTVEDSAWFGSLVKCGSIFGGLLGGQLVNMVGRRATLFISCGWFLAGWLCIIFAQSIPLLFSGRALTGVAVGIVAPAVPVFISEICPSNIRGLLNTGSNVALYCGILATYVLGKWLAYQHLAIALMAPTVLMSVLLFWTKESPRWLLQKGRHEAALESALFYYGPEGKKELEAIEESLCGTEQFRLRDLAVPHVYRPFLCMLMVMFVQQSSGVTVLVVYTHDIFREAGTSIPSDDCSIIIGVVQVVVVAIATVLTDRVGRKLLLLVSTLATSICLFLFGYSFYLKQHSPETFATSYTWLPIASVGLIFVAFNIGMGHLPWLLLGEMLPLRVKGFATGFCTAFSFGYSFLLIKEFYRLQFVLGVAGSYWLFGVLLLVGFLLFWIFLPETKRKTLEEIEQLFGKQVVDLASEAVIRKSNRV
ncbi:solute carrier family 2, facilitated glucose transporter member 8-like [Dermacentor variabilis]|uniref:solute carrier family 2, facilitated glucose transporter member 8-like n=1 Tax=Dermacentor variabilis TaxID=34621 RepID=UPI003F5ADFCA